MQIIPTRIHGVIDYVTGLLLIAAPWLFGFADGTAAQWVPVILGAGVIAYSLFTDYELAAVRAIPMPVHLLLDVGGGIVLLLSPWLFGFADRIIWPHVLVGSMEIVIPAMTVRHSQVGRTSARSERVDQL